MLKLIDYVNVIPDKRLVSLPKEEKLKLIDFSLDERKNKRGLVITYDLSHSGRRINNRIYTTVGQQKGIDSLLKPYPKPILQNHDGHKDPIGRFVDGWWEDLSNEAMGFFTDINSFMEFKDAFNSDDPEKIYSTMKKYNLLTNKEWPGLGRMRAKAKITDKDAIEKFLDGRYITFSAGSTTNRHVCSICTSDWATGDFCEHRHGKIYDGDVCVFITGDFKVLEGSVVNLPADDLSQLYSMEFLNDDSKDMNLNISEFQLDNSSIALSDSLYSLEEEEMKMKETLIPSEDQKEEADIALDMLKEEVRKEEKIDLSDVVMEKIYQYIVKNLEKRDETEILKEVSEDNLNEKENELESSQEDSKEDSKEESVNEDEVSVGSDPAGLQIEKVMKYKVEIPVVEVDKLEKPIEELTSNIIGDFDGDLIASNTEVPSEELQPVLDIDVDWYLLDAALQFELGDAKLSTEKREGLSASSFCGPERSFPVPDCAHVTAARRLIGRAKLSTDQKAKVLACVDRKAKSMSCDTVESDNSSFSEELQSLKQEIKELKEQLSFDLKRKAFFEKEVLENPSISSSDDVSSPRETLIKNLGTYEQKIVKKYNEILQKDGEAFANMYINSKSRYLKKGFDPKKYIN